MYSVIVLCNILCLGLAIVDGAYNSESLMFNGEEGPQWKSSNGLVFLRPPVRRSLEDPNHNMKDAQDMKWLGLGVLSDMKGFFDNLQTNIDTLEEPHDRQKENVNFLDKDFMLQIPRGHGFRHNIRPSHNIRNFVDYSDGQNLRRSNMYDPNLLWSGLGKKR